MNDISVSHNDVNVLTTVAYLQRCDVMLCDRQVGKVPKARLVALDLRATQVPQAALDTLATPVQRDLQVLVGVPE